MRYEAFCTFLCDSIRWGLYTRFFEHELNELHEYFLHTDLTDHTDLYTRFF